jgi:hypothetical protein
MGGDLVPPACKENLILHPGGVVVIDNTQNCWQHCQHARQTDHWF